jgi:hypothetical protein
MRRNKFIKYCTLIAFTGLVACTDLEEKVLDEQLGTDLVNDPNNMVALINAPYASLRRTIEWYTTGLCRKSRPTKLLFLPGAPIGMIMENGAIAPSNLDSRPCSYEKRMGSFKSGSVARQCGN